MKTLSLGQMFTDEEIDHACRLFAEHAKGGKFASIVEEEVVKPNIERINKATGQENDTRYLAYVLEGALAGVL